MKVKKNIKLSKYTTFHIGGPAKFFTEIKNIKDLRESIDFAKKNKLEIFVLGGGSNVLIPDKGINGLVLKMSIGGIKIRGRNIYAGAGEVWDKIVVGAVSRGLSGIENLSLIPGTVGGAIYQNIGAYGAEIKDLVEYVDVFNIGSGKIERMTNESCSFGYRTSIFQKPKTRKIILGTSLKLSGHQILNTQYPDLNKLFKGDQPSLKDIRDAIIKIRKSKLVYPTKKIGTAGSFFKNPILNSKDYKILNNRHSDIIGIKSGGRKIKLSAGQLIEKTGWKGKNLEKVGISPKHALVLVSYRGAKSKNIIKLAGLVRKSVKNRFGIELEPEVRIML